MNDIEKKAEELRNSFRDARRNSKQSDLGTGEASSNPDTNSTGTEPVAGTTEQNSNGSAISGNQQATNTVRSVHRQDQRSGPVSRAVASIEGRIFGSPGSPPQNNQRVGQEPGRYGDSGSEVQSGRDNVSSGSSSSRSPKRLGNLERNEQEEPKFTPPAFFAPGTQRPNFNAPATTQTQEPVTAGIIQKRGRGRPPKKRIGQSEQLPYQIPTEQSKETPIQKVAHFIPSGGSKLSAKEAADLKPMLIAALEDEFEMLDKMIIGYAGLLPLEQGGEPIWSDISNKEMESFTKAFLSLGQKSPAVATVARTAVDLSDFIVGVTVLAPRLQKTGRIIREARAGKKQQSTGRISRRDRHARTHQQSESEAEQGS